MWIVLCEYFGTIDIIGNFKSYKAALAWVRTLPKDVQEYCHITHPFDDVTYKQYVEN